jgi:hypothetical protein
MPVYQMPLLQLGNEKMQAYGYNADCSPSPTARSFGGETGTTTGPFGEQMEGWGMGGAIGRQNPNAAPWDYEQGEIMYTEDWLRLIRNWHVVMPEPEDLRDAWVLITPNWDGWDEADASAIIEETGYFMPELGQWDFTVVQISKLGKDSVAERSGGGRSLFKWWRESLG